MTWLTLHKKWSFPLRISSSNVIKSAEIVDLVTLLKKSLMENCSFCAVSDFIQIYIHPGCTFPEKQLFECFWYSVSFLCYSYWSIWQKRGLVKGHDSEKHVLKLIHKTGTSQDTLNFVGLKEEITSAHWITA